MYKDVCSACSIKGLCSQPLLHLRLVLFAGIPVRCGLEGTSILFMKGFEELGMKQNGVHAMQMFPFPSLA